MNTIKWGIIGCGDVAERKSGPAFQQIEGSELLAVMRRNGAKAKDFAERHGVPEWYDQAEAILNHSEINAVYIATPPSSHKDLAIRALEAGKHVYLEKPMALSQQEAKEIVEHLTPHGPKLTVAHYRRQLPAFLKVKALLAEKAIGEVRFADIQIIQPAKSDLIAASEENWRVNPDISGGGLFHDLAPHQIDLMYQYFGPYEQVMGIAENQAGLNAADDIVSGMIAFESGVQFRGIWCFNAFEADQQDLCTIYGSEGSISFGFFGDRVLCRNKGRVEEFTFEHPPHIQHPMIESTVRYFQGKGPNPCSAEEGLVVMEIMDGFTLAAD